MEDDDASLVVDGSGEEVDDESSNRLRLAGGSLVPSVAVLALDASVDDEEEEEVALTSIDIHITFFCCTTPPSPSPSPPSYASVRIASADKECR